MFAGKSRGIETDMIVEGLREWIPHYCVGCVAHSVAR